jgi:hypothetical protein
MSRQQMATRTCAIKRVTIDSQTGRSGDKTAVSGLSALPCTSRLPLDSKAIERARTREMGALASLWLVYIFGEYDVREGDFVTLNGETTEYPVKEAIAWSALWKR